jgi:metal-responsive CopG/Arc/MetJ family transcriptional regulator
MTRTTISLPEELLRKLKILAAETGVSMAELIRQTMEHRVGATKQPRPKSIGVIDSGESDLSERAGDMKFEPRSWR